MTFSFLTEEVLEEVQRTAIGLGFASDPAGLNSGISPAFVGSFSTGNTDIARLLTLTRRMNSTRALVSGEVPLEKWLRNAITMSAGLAEERVFREALEMLSSDGAVAMLPPVEVAALPQDDRGGLEVVIEEDDTIDVAFLHTGATVSRSVAKLAVHLHFDGKPSTTKGDQPDLGLGTGWMLAPGLLVTNWHVINGRRPLEPKASDVDFDLQSRATAALFDFYDSTSPVHRVLSSGCVAHNEILDYAVLRLAADTSPRPPLRLRTSPVFKPQDRALQERVNVLQHPGGAPMRLGFRNNFVVTGSSDHLSYLTDTAGGSSGSPICDDAWYVAALHRGFRTIPGEPVSVWGKAIRQENYGTPIGRILKDLALHHPDLHREVVEGQRAQSREDAAQPSPQHGTNITATASGHAFMPVQGHGSQVINYGGA